MMVKNYDIIDATTLRIYSPTDAHGHLELLGDQLASVNLTACHNVSSVLRLIAAAHREQPTGWIVGYGWDDSLWTEAPHAAALESVASGRMIVLYRRDTHAVVVSSAVLAAAGYAAPCADPPGGVIVRDAAGRATGVLLDQAIAPILALMPPLAVVERRRRMRAALAHAVRAGWTTVHDLRLTAAAAEVLAELAAADALPLRVYAAVDTNDAAAHADWLRRGPLRRGRLHIGAAKFFADGALGSRGAALLADYADQPGWRGVLMHRADALLHGVRAALAAGFQPIIHAIGCAANRQALDVYAQVRAADPARFAQLRPRIEHAQILHRDDIARFAALGVIASIQPQHAVQDAAWAPQRIGDDPARCAYPYAALLRSGAAVACGSDFPIAPADLPAGLRAALHTGLTFDEAIRGWTAGAWWAGHADTAWPHAARTDYIDWTVDTTALFQGNLKQQQEVLAGARIVTIWVE